jgi:hypothetical protein
VSSTIEFFYDTTPPIATLKGLPYTTSTATNHFILTSDEYITNMFDIYTIDSTGARRDYPYQVVNSDNYIKDFFFYDYPLGPVSFYASVMDDVGNTIELEPLTLEIFRSEKLSCEVNDRIANDITVNSKEAFTIILNDEGSK